MILSLIVAASENNVIGKEGDLPWNLPAELKYYRSQTIGKPNIMGRRTHEGIGRPLPKRHNIVVSRTAGYTAEGCDVVSSVNDAIELAKKDGIEEAFVIGGEGIFREALPLIDRIYLTRVHTTIERGDTLFPEVDWDQWKEIRSEHHPADVENAIPFTMMVFERK